MTLTATHEELQSSGLALSYLRTVDRSLLHRRALSEVFLTDSRQLGGSHYVSAAQLPPAHAYYTDHIDATGDGDAIHIDPLLVLECCRQAETYGGHAYFGVGRDVKFIARSWAMDLPGLGGIAATAPVELIIDATVSGRRGARGRPTALSYAMRVFAAGTLLGTVTIDVGYLSPGAYARLRTARRGDAPHLAVVGPATVPSACLVPSASVGRTDPRNVVLTDPVFQDLSVRAGVRVPLENPSLFDHPLDHLPGMVLMEAARQACQLTATRVSEVAPGQVAVTGADMVFSSWAELDQPVAVQAALDRTDRAGQQRAAIAFEQRGAVIASGTMAVRTP